MSTDTGYVQYQIDLQGVGDLIQHNGVLADPANKIARQMKEISNKRKKVDADYERIAELEFQGSLYVDDKGAITVPPIVLESMVVEGAKINKQGQVALASLFVDPGVVFEFAGPQDIKSRMNDPECRLSTGVKVQRNRVQRTRPIFKDWRLRFTVSVIGDAIPADMLASWVANAGSLKGLGDWRPRHGRFTVTRVARLG